MVEAKFEASVGRTPRAGARDEYRYASSRYESSRYQSATLSRFSQALGDLCGAVLEPFDRVLGCCPSDGPVRGPQRAAFDRDSGLQGTAFDRDRGPPGAAFDRDVEREQLESQTVAELKETADKEGIDLGEAYLKADIVNKVLRARAAKAKAAAES